MRLDEATLEFIRQHRMEDVRRLAFLGDKFPEVDFRVALDQIRGWQQACRKLPSLARNPAIYYPPHLSMEQCSSETTAVYKARLARRLVPELGSMTDLTGGFGVDCYYIGRQFKTVDYVERQPDLCEIARHNFTVLRADGFGVYCQDGVDYLEQMRPVDLIYIDPARRDEHGGKTYAVKDCRPDVSGLKKMLVEKARYVMVKLSPMFDWHEAVKELQYVREIHILSVSNECKELLLVLSREQAGLLTLTCVNDGARFRCGAESVPVAYLEGDLRVGMYLCEPNASIQKAGCFGALSEAKGLKMLARDSHLFVSEEKIDDSIGRVFQIQSISSLNKKSVRQHLKSVSKANITVRNFPMTAAALRRRLRMGDGGDIFLFGTTLQDGGHTLIICKKAH
ncbi:SAM-dependent methyltransferase [Prevotella sp. oral taxon 376]|uniref:class I SAM-dependent methyltransferase n=1 Tax=Prevotella sp. oral taxon 376 TaxID=712466 RepID=UPI000D1EA7FC|nr:SAM-dependent methyltransferase [Prevotella sp. oral taxon 376]PTL33646.1 SAM-dependent methyltransferase [Prevotella sp. oral taxon 376]